MISTEMVTYAKFRPATKEEVQEARGGYLWQTLTGTYRLLSKIEGTVEMYRKGVGFIDWNRPILDSLSDRISLWRGYDEVQFIHTFSNFIADIFLIESESVLFEELFKAHRKDELFDLGKTITKIFNILEEMFPEEKFEMNDFLLVCDKVNTTAYHKMLSTFMSQAKINEFLPIIEEIAKTTLCQWEKKQVVDVAKETSLYVASNFTRLLFGDDYGSEGLAKAIHIINEYTLKAATIGVAEAEKQQYQEVLILLKGIIETILASDKLKLFNEYECTPSQKKGMLFALLFAGQETTSDLLTYVLWKLASNPELQERLHQEVQKVAAPSTQKIEAISRLFSESIKEFTPAYGIGKKCRTDVCLEYRLKGDEENSPPRTRIFYKDQIISLVISKFAENHPFPEGESHEKLFVFGSGPHMCPGRRLAVAEVTQLVTVLLKDYKIQTEVKSVTPKADITLRIKDPVPITLTRRES